MKWGHTGPKCSRTEPRCKSSRSTQNFVKTVYSEGKMMNSGEGSHPHRQALLLWSQAGSCTQNCRECWHTRFQARNGIVALRCTHLYLRRKKQEHLVTTFYSFQMRYPLCCCPPRPHAHEPLMPSSPTQLCPFWAIMYPVGQEQVKEPGLLMQRKSPWQACRPDTAAREHSSISAFKKQMAYCFIFF